MALQAHLNELKKKHEAIDGEIVAAQTHPGVDALQVAALKKRKLRLKEEIARMGQDNGASQQLAS